MRIQCPACNQQYDAEGDCNGQMIECPQCRQNFEAVPLPEPILIAAPIPAATAVPAAKSRLVYCLLALFLGGLGIHNFYSGHTRRGLLKLIITILLGWILPLSAAIAVLNIIEIFKVRRDVHGMPFEDRNPGLAAAIGAVSIAGLCILLAAGTFFIVTDIQARARLNRSACEFNVKQLIQFCQFFEAGNPNKMPESIAQLKKNDSLFEDPVVAAQALLCGGKGHSYLIVPGLTPKNSPAMPLVIGEIGGHSDFITVGCIGEYARQFRGRFKKYSDLLPMFDDITPEEKELLRARFQKWDAGDFEIAPAAAPAAASAKPAPLKRSNPDDYALKSAWGVKFDEPWSSAAAPVYSNPLGYAVYQVKSPVENGRHYVTVDAKTKKVMKTTLLVTCSSSRVASTVMTALATGICDDSGLAMTGGASKIVIADKPANRSPGRSVTLEQYRSSAKAEISVVHDLIPIPGDDRAGEKIIGALNLKFGERLEDSRSGSVAIFEKYRTYPDKPAFIGEAKALLDDNGRVAIIEIESKDFYGAEGMKTVLGIRESLERQYGMTMVYGRMDHQLYSGSFAYENGDRSVVIRMAMDDSGKSVRRFQIVYSDHKRMKAMTDRLAQDRAGKEDKEVSKAASFEGL